MITSRNVHGSIVAVELLSRFDLSISNVLTDKACGTNQILDYIQSADGEYAIPPRAIRSDHGAVTGVFTNIGEEQISIYNGTTLVGRGSFDFGTVPSNSPSAFASFTCPNYNDY